MSMILIIDDEASLVSSLTYALEDEGYRVHSACTGQSGLSELAVLQPDLVLLDLRLPDMTGLEVLEAIKREDDAPHVIMISAHGDTRAAVKAVKSGAADYLTKPFDLDELFHLIRSALEHSRMASEIDFHRRAVLHTSGLLGDSSVMRELNLTIERVAGSGTSRVLILGESGTGKALAARAVHNGSLRADGPFIEVNCASLPEQLIEAELFGAEKGAYTGAHQRRTGLVALADKGTLFLDEIGEMPMALQAKLLHFLENGQYRPIGSGRILTADVRVIAATNRELSIEVAAGRFREDLYYRLNVICLRMPALREHCDDVVLLAEHFSRQYAREERVSPIRFDSEARQILMSYYWPGNVRELRNLIERLTILFPGREIGVADLPPEMSRLRRETPVPVAFPSSIASQQDSASSIEPPSIGDSLAAAERELITSALRESDGHKGHAADRLGISRHAFKRRLKRLGM